MTRMPLLTVKWRALSLKRLSHMSELQRTGRWRHHFADQDAFDQALRDADADAEKWKRIAYASGSTSDEVVE